MHLEHDDKQFFGLGAIVGTITEFNNLVYAQIGSLDFIDSLGSAATIAFVSGFVGLFGKKVAEGIYSKFRSKPNLEDES